MTTPTKRKLADAPPSTRVTRSRLAKQRPDAKSPEEEVKIESLPPKEETDAVEVSDSEEKPRTKKRKPSKTSGGGKKGGGKEKKEAPLPDAEGDEVMEDLFCEEDGEEEDEIEEDGGGDDSVKKKKRSMLGKSSAMKRESDDDYNFIGEPISEAEAWERWPERYQKKKKSPDADDDMVPAKCHYKGANVDGCVYNLLDDVYVKAEPGTPDYIGRIVEFFESNDGGLYFTAQWFFRVEDTVIREIGDFHDPRRVFLSDEKNDNILDCIVSKINIVQIVPERKNKIPQCDLYYDMSYSVPYSSFANISSEKTQASSEESSIVSFDGANDSPKEVSLLDLYSGCGAMSTGLCHGANLAGLKMETKWAVDMNCYACASLERNHPHAKVRTENAEHFLKLLKEWETLCEKFSNFKPTDSDGDEGKEDGGAEIITGLGSGKEFEVGKILDICYGDPAKIGTEGIKFKIRWKGYGPEEDSWEPIENLGKCEERMGSFVIEGMNCNLLPRPGCVDVICGGPPCQGISGYNRFRNSKNPFDDVKNRQMITYMHIVDHLKPKYVLMENVVDILKFAKGFLGRYALSFLVSKNYQARLGIMAAGCYGLPQFRLRAFLWGALPSENLPPFPLPTHDVVVRGGIPNEFEPNLAAYGAGEPRALQKALFLSDAISDLPPVTNFEKRDEMPYTEEPTTDFQRFIKMPKIEMMSLSSEVQKGSCECKLFDHRPLQLNEDDCMRVQRIPKKKGANFRDLPGLQVNDNNVIELDPAVERELLPSGKPLVPNYAITFVKGKSLKPFGRLWWDETVPTVVTRAEPHNQIILHPGQDRVLTIRENARIQGFPDHYQLLGPVKQRYIQVGNAVAFPVSRALGYALGLAYQKQLPHTESSMKLPMNFPAIPNNASESDC